MIHCKTCRREKEASEFTQNSKQFKTCNACRLSRKSRKKPASERINNLQKCQDHAKNKNGKCLSAEYKNNRTKMLWECSHGHQWQTTYKEIKNGSWCPKCCGTEKLTLEMCQEFAKAKGGKCLSETYESNKTKLKWRCEEKHQWSARFDNIKNQNQWCPQCAGLARLTIEECQDHAKGKNGKCLSTEYKNSGTKMLWECEKHHQWESRFTDIKNQNTWCPKCAGLARLTIEECQDHAKGKNGKCLSTEYKNSGTKMLWECSRGHQWSATFNDIKNNNHWCPQCSAGRSETLCKEIMEIYTGGTFTKVRPDWLDGLELDGFCEELNMAFEYNGRQHYKYVPHFHRNGVSDFHAQQKRDQKKYKLCKERGIQLMIIPYQFNCSNPEELETFIVDQLELFEF